MVQCNRPAYRRWVAPWGATVKLAAPVSSLYLNQPAMPIPNADFFIAMH
jgi:hypothetical protein